MGFYKIVSGNDDRGLILDAGTGDGRKEWEEFKQRFFSDGAVKFEETETSVKMTKTFGPKNIVMTWDLHLVTFEQWPYTVGFLDDSIGVDVELFRFDAESDEDADEQFRLYCVTRRINPAYLYCEALPRPTDDRSDDCDVRHMGRLERY